jgi:hypothetical protein
MSDSDNEVFPYRSGYVTPPLSPSKTASTEGWYSPRTPGSPRKTHSCLFTRDFDERVDTLLFTPPASPTKSRPSWLLSALTIPEVLHASDELISSQPDNRSPVKQCILARSSRLSSLWSYTPSRLHTPLTLDANEHYHDDFSRPLPVTCLHTPTLDDQSPITRQMPRRSLSDSLATASVARCSPTFFEPNTNNRDTNGLFIPPSTKINLGDKDLSPIKLRPFSLRCASSPLRPSQWVVHGSMLQTPRKGPSCTPDRFIACRRPPTVTRESFELNKPAERLDTNQLVRSGRPIGDPFSHRLRRSGRLNDELHGLREVHSLIVGRASTHERNVSLANRRNSITLGTRQISIGAVWNVGGPSAVSDTVVGVATGRGGMLGRGTNAPLYTSTFLNRADPEAELEAYERRLALAFDVDQTDRILQHSPTPFTSNNTKCGSATSRAKHTWRDSAWIKDGVTLRLSSAVPKYSPLLLTTL